MTAITAQGQAEEPKKTDTYCLLLFNRPGTAVLLEARASGYALPVVDIPRFTRSAQEITTLLRDRWLIPAVLLFPGVLQQNPNPVYFAALEAQVQTCTPPEGTDWVPVHYAISHLLKSENQNVLESSYLKITNSLVVENPEPFGRLGWLSSLQDWVGAVIGPLGIELKDFQQWNGSESFLLIRFNTTDRPVWFKAVGKPNVHELPITLALAKLFPEYLPSILARHPTYHGWLMADADVPSLHELEDSSAWKNTATALADLQIASVEAIDDLLEAGCRDLRAGTLLKLVDPFLEVIAKLMQQQAKVPPPILLPHELSDLGATLKNAVHCLQSAGIPDTLGHSDFNPGNVLVGSERCVFVDWAEAHVSHPFLTFEYLISHLRKDYSTFVRFEAAIRSSYARRWQSISLPEQVSEAFLFSSLVAVFAYAVAGNSWRDPEQLKIPGVPGYLRSLARRMMQQASSVPRRRVECTRC
jgi:hypothetical protein